MIFYSSALFFPSNNLNALWFPSVAFVYDQVTNFWRFIWLSPLMHFLLFKLLVVLWIWSLTRSLLYQRIRVMTSFYAFANINISNFCYMKYTQVMSLISWRHLSSYLVKQFHLCKFNSIKCLKLKISVSVSVHLQYHKKDPPSHVNDMFQLGA